MLGKRQLLPGICGDGMLRTRLFAGYLQTVTAANSVSLPVVQDPCRGVAATHVYLVCALRLTQSTESSMGTLRSWMLPTGLPGDL